MSLFRGKRVALDDEVVHSLVGTNIPDMDW